MNQARQSPNAPLRKTFTRWLPLGVLALGVVVFFASGLNRQINFDALAGQYAALVAAVEANFVFSVLGAFLIYTAATAFSIPVAWLLTVSVGVIFGWQWAVLIVTTGATLGAAVLFLATRLALADFFRRRAGDALNRMAAGFREDATSYMLFLRLAPVVPFALVNVVPAILGVPFRTFVWTTFVGIIPGVLAYAFAGEGLRSIVAERAAACDAGVPPCGSPLAPGDLVTPEIGMAFALLAVVSLIPVVVKRLRSRRGE